MARWIKDKESLETQQWTSISLSGSDYLMKSYFGADSYAILVTDFNNVWKETLVGDDLQKRSKVLNPLVDTDTTVILKQLAHRVHNPGQYTYTVEVVNSTEFVVLVEGLLLSTTLKYLWKFECTKALPNTLSSHLLHPLLSATRELLRRQQEMSSLLARKDREIKDYKDSGAVLSRKHLQTKPFDINTFNKDMTKSSEFEESVSHPLELLNNHNWNDLYSDITSCSVWLTKSGDQSDDKEATNSPVSPHAACPSSTSPSKSPQKKKLPVVESPEKIKEEEMSRRATLQRQLAEKTKGKTKKRKLM